MHTLLISNSGRRTRVAIIDKSNTLTFYDEASPHSKQLRGTVYNAVATSVCPEFDAVFVKYDKQRNDGFLPLDNIANSYFGVAHDELLSSAEKAKRIKSGMEFIVQVRKDQMAQSEKGAALTTEISLAGRYLVILPYSSNKLAISRRADDEQRDKAKELIAQLNPPAHMGIIIRTAGIDCQFDDLRNDFEGLCRQWEHIQAKSKNQHNVSLLHEEESVIIRSLQNMSDKTQSIIVNTTELSDEIHDYLRTHRPDLNPETLVQMYDESERSPMMSHYNIEAQIDKIFDQSHSLPGGGSIVIQGTEAGHMVDVNSGSSNSGNNIEETALATNLQAAAAVASLLRLRDTGGIIVIDFIDMASKENRAAVEQRFMQLIDDDRARIKCEPISALTGCMYVLRQRMGNPFFESSLTPVVDNDRVMMGMKRSVESYAYKVLSIIENSAFHQSHLIHVQVPCDVASYLLNEERDTLRAIEARCQCEITIIPVPYKQFKYTLKRFRAEDNQPLPEQPRSYEQIPDDQEAPEWTPKELTTRKNRRTPSTRKTQSKTAEKASTGILGGLYQLVFGSPNTSVHPKSASTSKTNTERRSNRRGGRRGGRRTDNAVTHTNERGPRNESQQNNRTHRRRGPRRNSNRSQMDDNRQPMTDSTSHRDSDKQPRHNAATMDSLADD